MSIFANLLPILAAWVAMIVGFALGYATRAHMSRSRRHMYGGRRPLR
jgi:hypothetical protein